MENFEEKLVNDIQVRILEDIKKSNLVELPYGNRIKIPVELIQKAYKEINQDRIMKMVKENIEEQIAKSIVNALLTEVTTDTKKLMSNNELREQLKYRVYPKIIEIIESTNKQNLEFNK